MSTKRLRINFRSPHSLDWVLDRLQEVTPFEWGYRALCPAHADGNPSLTIKLYDEETGPGYSIKCMAGCTYREIMEAIELPGEENARPAVEEIGLEVVQGGEGDESGEDGESKALVAWETYTGVQVDFWKRLGVVERGNEIGFQMSGGHKWRRGSERYFDKGAKPDFWPPLPRTPLREMWLCEGESDTGILQFLGFPAYTLGGIDNFKVLEVADKLERWGVARVAIIFDADRYGRGAAEKLAAGLADQGFNVANIDIIPLLRDRIVEKDIRDVYLRLGPALKPELERRVKWEFEDNLAPTSDEYIDRAKDDVPWVCEDIAARGSLTLFTGEAKKGKTTFVFSLLEAMGRAFFEEDVEVIGQKVAPGSVVYMTEDNPQAWKVKATNHLTSGKHISVMPHSDYTGKSFAEKLLAAERVIQYRKAALLIVDTIPVWADIENENDATHVNRQMELLRRLAERNNVAVIAIHYTTKSGERYRGSGAFIAVPDIVADLAVLLRNGRELRCLSILSKLDISPEPIYYEFNRETKALELRADVDVSVRVVSRGLEEATGVPTPGSARSPEWILDALTKLATTTSFAGYGTIKEMFDVMEERFPGPHSAQMKQVRASVRLLVDGGVLESAQLDQRGTLGYRTVKAVEE